MPGFFLREALQMVRRISVKSEMLYRNTFLKFTKPKKLQTSAH